MNIHEKIRYAKDEHLTILRVTESAYLIEDDRNATAYVVTGTQRALVVDTCFGYENYAEVVASITDLPTIVVNTPEHGDHCGRNGYFENAYIGEAELPQYENATRPGARTDGAPAACPAEVLHEGDTIDLGDRKIEVIHFAGHTPGALCLLDRKERILYTGDSILGRTVYLFMQNSVSVSEMKKSLLHIKEFSDGFDQLATGHGRTLDPVTYIDALIDACDTILAGAPADRFGTIEVHGMTLPCCYYPGENGMQATLIYREDLVR